MADDPIELPQINVTPDPSSGTPGGGTGGTPDAGGNSVSPDGQAAGQTPINESGQGGAISSRQFIRQIRAQVGGAGKLDLSNLHVEFVVRQADSQQPNWAYLRIYNLSTKTTELGMLKEFTKLTIEAGYRGRIGPIFEGEVVQKKFGKLPNGVDTYFDILGQSGRQAYGFATLNKTLKAGHTYKDIVDEAVKSMKEHGIEVGHIDELPKKKMPRASVLHGMTRDILRDVAAATNTSWSIQGKKLQIVKNDGYLPGSTKIINADTGMIGKPEQTINGIIVKVLIDSGMHVGSQVQIDQKSINQANYNAMFGGGQEVGDYQKDIIPSIAADGKYIVKRVDHDGELEGTPWYTTLTCLAPGDNSVGGGRTEVESGLAGVGQRAIPEDEQSKGGNGGSQ